MYYHIHFVGLQDLLGLCLSLGEPERAGSPEISVPYTRCSTERLPQCLLFELFLQGQYSRYFVSVCIRCKGITEEVKSLRSLQIPEC